jgi:hypothetical protein
MRIAIHHCDYSIIQHLNHQSQWDCQKGKSWIFRGLQHKGAAGAAPFNIVEVQFQVKFASVLSH